MTQSYSNALIKYVLSHYIEIMYGKITIEEMGEYCKGKSGKNPLETALIWKADCDQALVSLSNRKHGWSDALRDGMSDSMITHLARSNEVSDMQRSLISDCILKDCGKFCKRTCGKNAPETCWNEGIISRLRKYLNHEGRDDQGKFVTPRNADTVKLTEG
jgi:hypothetical protein